MIAVGYEYTTDAASQVVYDQIQATGENCSVWRTTTPEMDRWFVLGIFEEQAELDRTDWGGGVEFMLTPEQRDWCIRRRVGRAVAAYVNEEGHINETRHYEPETAPRIPGDRTGFSVGKVAGSITPDEVL